MEIVCGTLPSVTLNGAEVCARLQIPRGMEIAGVDRCLERLREAAVLRYAYVTTPVTLGDGRCRLDFGEIPGEDLARYLNGCGEAIVLGVTLGLGVDRLLTRLKLTSHATAEHFITDGLASAMAEALYNEMHERLSAEACLKPGFSPGYGDVPLWVQKPLLARLQADRTLGITLNDGYLMTPTKSITSLIGVKGRSAE